MSCSGERRSDRYKVTDECPLLGEERTSNIRRLRSAFDPGCVKTCTSRECAELFSLSSSPSSGRKYFWFSNLRNRDGISTRRLNVGVFTQPRPTTDIRSAYDQVRGHSSVRSAIAFTANIEAPSHPHREGTGSTTI